MKRRTRRPQAIREFVLGNVEEHPREITSIAAEHFGVSRQGVCSHIRALTKEGLLTATGRTSGREYHLAPLVSEFFVIPVTSDLEEHVQWRRRVSPLLHDVADNVMNICQYGFEEMVNNVVSHSEGDTLTIKVVQNAVAVQLVVFDDGVGIFNKIQNAFGYDDPRHALLELSKGKVTSDPDRHTGEGIFFSSRMFDEFIIWSGTLFYRRKKGIDDWLIEAEDRSHIQGTWVQMSIHPEAEYTTTEIFDNFATGEDKDFSRTHVPIKLARYETEQLLSRSQARRVLDRFDRFKEVILDFQGVDQIGQAFADEIFRVFAKEQPSIGIRWVNESIQVRQMILRAKSGSDSPTPSS